MGRGRAGFRAVRRRRLTCDDRRTTTESIGNDEAKLLISAGIAMLLGLSCHMVFHSISELLGRLGPTKRSLLKMSSKPIMDQVDEAITMGA